VLERSAPAIKNLRTLAASATQVYLATDPDREGEADCLAYPDGRGLKQPERVTFNEITAKAIQAAIASPRKIDIRLVAAQEARRALDRLVGYMVSPELPSSSQRQMVCRAGAIPGPAADRRS
jgi:DNA topoisomerase-1